MTRLLLVLLIVLAFPAVAAAKPDPVTWCGSDEVSADRVPDVELSSADQIRFVYAVPQDGTDQFLSYASGIATDAAWIDQWWTTQDPSRTPRFDRYPFANCTSTFGQLDIGFVRLTQPASDFSGLADPSIGLDRVFASLPGPSQKTIVYYDGPIANERLCGETDYLATTSGGAQGLAYVFLQSGCELGPPGDGGTAETAAHELLHNLGAVPDGAPHNCPDSAGHACDSTSDIMAQFLDEGSNLDKVFLDVGRDDYYAHSGAWWDVQDSAWLSNLPQHPFSLAVAGSGSLIVKAGTVPLACDTGCTGLSLDNGVSVSMIAVAAPGWAFSSWTGACGGKQALCTFAVTDATDATATFVKAPLRVTAAVTGSGRVTSAPAGIACPGACAKTFAGSQVTLNAKPTRGWKFVGWSGACTGVGRCVVTAAGTTRAKFARR